MGPRNPRCFEQPEFGLQVGRRVLREAIWTKGSGGGSPNGLVQRQHANLRDAFEERTGTTTHRLRDRVGGLLKRREKTRNLRTIERL